MPHTELPALTGQEKERALVTLRKTYEAIQEAREYFKTAKGEGARQSARNILKVLKGAYNNLYSNIHGHPYYTLASDAESSIQKISISLSSQDVDQSIAEGKLVKIELLASTGYGFSQRLVDFLSQVGDYTAGGSSRDIGILDASDAQEKGIKLFIDGDGNDRILNVKVS